MVSEERMKDMFESILNSTPRVQYYPAFDPTTEEHRGIRALAYDGVDLKGQHTKIFAHMGYPENTDDPVPAVVLIHGGGGHPEDNWIRKWTERGYAAISMDTTGYFPLKPTPCLYEERFEELGRELVPPFREEGYTVAPDKSDMKDTDLPITEQWMYHAVAAAILAHNVLRADPRIDSEKIGVSGISWGSVITSILIGHDTRFAFAVPIYGSGYLGFGQGECCKFFQSVGVLPWLAERNFDKVTIPVLWLCWNDDWAFSINSNGLSYAATKDNNPNIRLSMIHEMRHSHRYGYTPEVPYLYVDAVLAGKTPPEVEAMYNGRKLTYRSSVPAERVRLFHINGQLIYGKQVKYERADSFMEQEWEIMDLDPAETTAVLPEDAVGTYVEFTFTDGMVFATPYHE